MGKDTKSYKEMKYGRRLKGPILVSPREINKAVQGDEIGFKTLETEAMMRVPSGAEGQHIELMGDTGRRQNDAHHAAAPADTVSW